MGSNRMINRTILIHSGDIFNYYETKEGMNALMDPERQSNEALTNNLEFDFDENNSIVLNEEENIIRLRKESDYPQTTCSRYPECHELTLKIFIHNKMNFLINKCLTMVLNELQFAYVDNLIVSFDSDAADDEIDSIWSSVVQEKKEGRAKAIGVAHFCQHKLTKLV